MVSQLGLRIQMVDRKEITHTKFEFKQATGDGT